MNRVTQHLNRPGTAPPLWPNSPSVRIGRHTEDDATQGEWARSELVYPRAVAVLGFSADRTTVNVPTGEPHGTRWETRRLTLPGWGSVIWSGLIRPGDQVAYTDSLVLPVGHLVERLNGLLLGMPTGLEWMQPQYAAQLLTRRLNRMLTGLSVYVYHADPQSWGGRWPVGDTILSRWQMIAGVPVICWDAELDLRDLWTY